jgi:uncharacterized protein YkwD
MRKPLAVACLASALLLAAANATPTADTELPPLPPPAAPPPDSEGAGDRPPVVAARKPAAKPRPRIARAPAKKAQRPADAASRRRVSGADVLAGPESGVQQRVLALVNENRRHGGCRDLALDRRLIEVANDHAADMARHDYFAHESRDGDDAGDRVRDSGYRWRRYGENIARGAGSPRDVVDDWMNSPPHRANIMDCRLHEVGLGLALADDHTAYWVQDLATPR